MNPNKWKEFKHAQAHPKQYSALRRKKKNFPKSMRRFVTR